MNQFLRRLVVLQPGEAPALLASFATLLFMFTSYTILRPVRDALGITSGLESIPYLFWGVFVAMLLLQPLYGWLTSRFPRSVFLPWVYGFFVLNLLPFWVWFHVQSDHTWIARTYYVWVSVFNLFVVAAFWSLMADVFSREQAGRLFGFIWAGASTGGIIGPALTRQLAVPLGAINLLPVSAGLLVLSMVFMAQVIRWQRRQAANTPQAVAALAAGRPAPRADSGVGGGVFAAFGQVARSPYLLGIAALRAAYDLGLDLSVPRAAGVRRQGVQQRRTSARVSLPPSIFACRPCRWRCSSSCSAGCSGGSACARCSPRCRSS